MAKSQTAEVLLQWRVDTASVNRVRASFANMETELGDLRAELTDVGTAAQQGVSGLRQRFAQGETAINSMQDEVEQLRAELLRLDDVTVTPTVDVQRTGAGSAGGSSGLVGGLTTLDQIGRIGTQVGGGLGATALGNSVNLIGDVAGAAATMNPILIGSAAAIGAVSVITTELTRAYNEARKAAADYLAKQTEINLLLAQGDTEELQAQRERLTAELAARDRTAEPLRALVERFWELMQRSGSELGMTYAEIVAELEKIPHQIYQLTNGRIDNIQAAGDELAQFDAETQNIAGDLAMVELGLQRVVNKVVEFGDKGAIALDALLYKVSKGEKGVAATGIQGGIGSGMTSFASIQAQMDADLLSTRTGAYMEAVTQTVHAQESLTKAQNASNEAVTASAQRISDINAKLQSDLTAAETDRQTDLADAAREAGDQRIKIEEETGKERQRIQKRFERSYNDAVAERDALAAKRAEDQRNDDVDQLGDRYKDQLKTVDESLKKQQQVIDARYKAQVATANAAAQAAVRAEQAAAQARISALQQGVQAAQVALVNAQQAEFLTRANFYNQSLSQAQVWANLMQLYTSYGFSIPAGAGGSGGGGIGGRTLPTPMATGGPVIAGRPYVVGDGGGPELFVPSTNGRIIPHGAAFTINVTGAQSDTIRAVSRQQALNAFDGILRQMGVA